MQGLSGALSQPTRWSVICCYGRQADHDDDDEGARSIEPLWRTSRRGEKKMLKRVAEGGGLTLDDVRSSLMRKQALGRAPSFESAPKGVKRGGVAGRVGGESPD